jgi:hypothetical protein
MALDFLLMSRGFNFFLLLRDEQNSKCGWLLVVIKCIYLPPTYVHFIQDIEDRCLLLTSSTSFVDLPFVIPSFYAKPSTHRMRDPGSIVPHIRPKMLTDNQMS